MKPQNHMALKEWAIVLEALEEAKQTVLLRKGGVHDEGGEFRPEHDEFFLYPTLEHESPENVKADWRPRLAKIERTLKADPKHVKFRLYAEAEEVRKVTDWEACRRLIPFTVLSDAAVEKRFKYGEWEGLYLLLVRTYVLPVPMDLLVKPAYEGCKSWVKLETGLFTVGSTPVIPDGAWGPTKQKILKVLQG